MSHHAYYLTRHEKHLLKRSQKIIYTLNQAFNPYILHRLEQDIIQTSARIVRRRGRIRILTKGNQIEPLAWSIGQKIRAARERKDWTQEELAEQTGIARANIARLESGQYVPKIKTIKRVAEALNLDVADLIRMPGYKATNEDSDWLEAGINE